jgi:hypothetical protein
MITKQQLLNLYIDCHSELFQVNDDESMQKYMEELRDCDLVDDLYGGEEVDYESIELTDLQCKALVNVCRTIVDHKDRFDMTTWHDNTHPCGTSHCMAGWAIATELNDFNVSSIDRSLEEQIYSILEKYGYGKSEYCFYDSYVASAILSPLVYPFFYLLGNDSSSVVYDKFVLPVLEIADNNG